MTSTAADILIDSLQDWGVEVIFGIPGDGINGIMDALRRRQDKVRSVQVRHEEAAALYGLRLCQIYRQARGLLGHVGTRWDPPAKRSL